MAGMEQPLSFKDPEGHQVAGILALPPNKSHHIAILCHGFLSSKNSNTNNILTQQLLSQGIATFRFDFFGHGDSQGPFEDITVTLAIQLVAILHSAWLAPPSGTDPAQVD